MPKSPKPTLDEQLERERALLHTLINSVPDGMFLKDTESRFILANRAIAAAMGAADPKDLIGKTDHDFYPKEQADEYLADERSVLETGRGILDKEEPKKVAGVERWILVTKLPVFDHAGSLIGLVGVSRDITERKRAAEALQNEHNRLRTLIDILPHSVYMKDTAGRKVMTNPVDLHMMGRTTEAEVLGKTDFDFFSRHVAEAFLADDQCVMRTGHPIINREEFYFDGQGRKIWLLTSKVPLRDAGGAVSGLLGVGRDITELKEREAQMREQAQLLDISSDAIVVRDIDNRVRYWNRSAETTWGWTAGEAIGADADELLHRKRPDEPKQALRAVLEQGGWSGDLHCGTKDGREVLGEARWTLVRDEAGKPHSILCVSTDVTETRAIQAQLLRAQRLESLGTLAGGIAHDLNNVLTPIVMGLESLGPAIADEKSLEILATIVRSAKRGANVLKQVLGFARGMEGEHREVHLRAVLEEVAAIITETFPKSIEVQLRATDELRPVMGSTTQLHQVMMNLCVNARDAMPEGGTLTLSARNVELDEAYARTHLDAKAAAYVMFMVEDTGTGMSPQTLEKIFDPFFTTKDPGKGTGLGLSTTLSIVKGHGGFINVYSEPGRGSSFRVYVPVAPQPSGPAAPAPKAALPSGHGELVILIDDEEAVRETTKRALEQHGYRVATAADGSDGVARFVEHRGEVSCIITDMMMPHMDGAATIRTIRRLDPKMKVIAMSGLPANGYVTEARGVGAQAFLTKPYTTELILRTLDEVLRAD